MNTIENIKAFLAEKNIAIVGASRKKTGFGLAVLKELSQAGYNVVAVNPNAESIEGYKLYKNIQELPAEFNAVHIITNKKRTTQIVKESLDKGIKNIWIQQMSQTPEALEIAKNAHVNLINKECVFMFLEPTKFPHSFHRSIKKFFGSYPKSASHLTVSQN